MSNCKYLDSSKNPAINMLRECIQDNNSLNCNENVMKVENLMKDTTRIDNISLQRGIIDYNISGYTSNIFPQPKENISIFNNIEGFTNSKKRYIPDTIGEFTIQAGEKCPDGYDYNKDTGECIQRCIHCKYKDSMKLKSRQYNEYDPCFPGGVYNGIDSNGNIKCTCGKDNEYCSSIFTADGIFLEGKKMILNVGNTNMIKSLFNLESL